MICCKPHYNLDVCLISTPDASESVSFSICVFFFLLVLASHDVSVKASGILGTP